MKRSSRINTFRTSKISRLLFDLRIPILIVVVSLVFSILSRSFFTLKTLTSLLSLIAAYGIIAIGQTLIILVGDLDISVGAIASISGLLLVRLMSSSTLLAIVVCLLFGALVGLVNGVIISRLKVNSLIATISMSFLLTGIAHLISDGTIHLKNQSLVSFANKTVASVPYIAVIYIVLTVLVQYVLKRTVLGLKLYCIGANRVSCDFSGIDVSKYELIVFVLSGFFASLGGFVYSSKLAAASPLIGSDIPIYVITAVLLGGTTIGGGYGDVIKTFMGVLLITLITKGLTVLNVEAYFQNMIIGIILIFLLFIGQRLIGRGRLGI